MPATPEPATHSAVLAFDFGLKRIGVAIGDELIGVAHPLTTIESETRAARFSAIGVLIEQWQPWRVVVGLPLRDDGSEHPFGRTCRRFANQIEGRYGIPAVLIDERWTSVLAEAELSESATRHRKKSTIDQLAAREILQSYFDARATPS